MGTKPQALDHDRHQDPPAVAERPQLALGAGDPRVIRDRDLDHPQPPRDRLAGQLGLDLEARRAELHRRAKAAVEGAVAREQVGVPRPDQEPERRADQALPRPRVKVIAPAPAAAAAAPTAMSAVPSSTGATRSGAASAG